MNKIRMSPPKVSIKKAKITAFHSLGMLEQKLKDRVIFPLLIVTSGIMFFVNLVLSGFASNPKISHGIFKRGIANVSETYPLNITPDGWTFSIWGIIYLLQFGAVLYSLALLCRQTEKGPAYFNPPVLSPLFFVFFSLSSSFVSGWLFMWDSLMLISSSVFLLCTVICLWTAFTIASERLSFFQSELIDSGRSLDVKVITICVLNGLGMYATWSVIATLLNVGVVVVYRIGHPFSNETTSIVALSCVAVFLVLYALVDMIVSKRVCQFIFTPYVTVIWAMSGIISKNWNTDNVSSIMSAVLLGCGVIALLVKIGVSISCKMSNRNPYRRMKVAVPVN